MAMFGALSRLSMTATTWLAQVDTRPGASGAAPVAGAAGKPAPSGTEGSGWTQIVLRSEEHTSELQSHLNLVCRLLLEKKKR